MLGGLDRADWRISARISAPKTDWRSLHPRAAMSRREAQYQAQYQAAKRNITTRDLALLIPAPKAARDCASAGGLLADEERTTRWLLPALASLAHLSPGHLGE